MAQSAERAAVNRKVRGSNPRRAVIFSMVIGRRVFFNIVTTESNLSS